MDARPSKYGVGRVDGENLVFTQSWFNQIPLLIAIALVTAIVIYITVSLPYYAFLPIKFQQAIIQIPVLLLLPIILLLKVFYIIHNERFVLTPEYMIHITGRLNWKERTVRLEYTRIQEIEIDQTLLQKLFNLGDVVILPVAGSSTTNIHMHGTSSPREVKDAIREFETRSLPR